VKNSARSLKAAAARF